MYAFIDVFSKVVASCRQIYLSYNYYPKRLYNKLLGKTKKNIAIIPRFTIKNVNYVITTLQVIKSTIITNKRYKTFLL